MRYFGLVLLLGLCAVGLLGQTAPAKPGAATELHWTATAIPNLEMAVVSGDPAAAGPFVLRFRTLQQVRIPPHWYASDEHVTVLRGAPSLGVGERYLTTALRQLHSGEQVVMRKQQRYFALLNPGSEVQLQGDGPFTPNWVDASALKAIKQKDVESNSDRTRMKAEQDKR